MAEAPLAGRPGIRKQLLAEANRARNRHQDRRAIALYRRLLLEDPREVEVALRLAPLLAAHSEPFEAWQLFRMAATELSQARRHEACLGALRDACRSVPHEYDAWRMRAELELRLGREEAAYDTLLEGRRHFDRPQTITRAIALLTRARAIEPWDPEAALDLAHLYTRIGLAGVALELLAGLAQRVAGRTLRRVCGLQWRITLSFGHAWLWLLALLRELRGERDAGSRVLTRRSSPPPEGGRSRAPAAGEPIPFDPQVSA